MKGHYVDASGKPVYWGPQGKRAAPDWVWVTGGASRVGKAERWNGAAWVADAAAKAEKDAHEKAKADRAQAARDLPATLAALEARIAALESST